MSLVSPVPPVERLLSRETRVTDWGGLEAATVKHTARPKTEAELIALVRYAAANKVKVSLRGAGHSTGGQSFCEGGLMIDLRDLNQILQLDKGRKIVRVQAGASWDSLTAALEPLGLAITTRQEFALFTVGGSLAANIHGRTVDHGCIIESVEAFRLLKPDGEVLTVSRTENAELFSLVIGGYGLFGIILDATLRLVEDRPIRKTEVVLMEREALCAAYGARVHRDRANTAICFGYLDPSCTRGFYLTYTYADNPGDSTPEELKRDDISPRLFNFLVGLQRRLAFMRRRAFTLLWSNSGKPEVTLRSRRLLLYEQVPRVMRHVLLQKYLVPLEHFGEFVRRVGAIYRRYSNDLPVLPIHFHYVPACTEAFLTITPQDCVCLIPCYLAWKRSAAWRQTLQKATDELLNAALDLGGRYYLTFDILASGEQLRRAYPRWDSFVALKRKYDPDELFSSQFYEKYALRQD